MPYRHESEIEEEDRMEGRHGRRGEQEARGMWYRQGRYSMWQAGAWHTTHAVRMAWMQRAGSEVLQQQ